MVIPRHRIFFEKAPCVGIRCNNISLYIFQFKYIAWIWKESKIDQHRICNFGIWMSRDNPCYQFYKNQSFFLGKKIGSKLIWTKKKLCSALKKGSIRGLHVINFDNKKRNIAASQIWRKFPTIMPELKKFWEQCKLGKYNVPAAWHDAPS